MSTLHLTIVICTVFLSASAQLILKLGAEQIANKNNGIIYGDSIVSALMVFMNPFIFFGMVIYVLSAGIWIWVLSKVDISLAYPFISISFILTLVFGALVFNEPINTAKLIGTTLIITGCLFIARS